MLKPILRPAQVVVTQRDRPNALSGRHMDRVQNRRCHKGHHFFTDAGNPPIGFDVIDAYLAWELIHADGDVSVEISLLHDPVAE